MTAATVGSEDTKARPVHMLSDLQLLWNRLMTCIGTFAIGVVAALLTSGALRFALLEAHPNCGDKFKPEWQRPNGPVCGEDFPASTVLLYGAAFALFLLLIALPPVISWRDHAF